MLVSAIVSRAATILQDTTNVRWPEAELVDWVNDGQREIVLLRPEAGAKTAVHQLVAGAAQTLPSDGTELVEITRNMGTDGTTPGPVARIIDREELDAIDPDWPTATASATVVHYIYNARNPTGFYVYPPQPASGQGYVEVVYAATPATVASGDSLGLDDIYASAVLDYVLYRAYQKDGEQAESARRSNTHYTAMLNALGVKAKNNLVFNPNRTSPPYNPATVGE